MGSLAELKCKLQGEGRAGRLGTVGGAMARALAAQGATQGHPSVPLLFLSGSTPGWGCYHPEWVAAPYVRN